MTVCECSCCQTWRDILIRDLKTATKCSAKRIGTLRKRFGNAVELLHNVVAWDGHEIPLSLRDKIRDFVEGVSIK